MVVPWYPPESPDDTTFYLPPPPPPRRHPADETGILVFRLVMAFLFSLFALLLCTCCTGYRNRQARAEGNAAAAAERRTQLEPRARNDGGGAVARLPSFKYSLTVKHNVTGGAEEAATCSVCLAAFQLGEAVRLLPACLHLYHAECIDPWLDAHSTCPICRSDTDPTTMSGGRVPPV